jgi:xanthine dehydrogenase YagR molybdenum-binding subunit
MNDQGHSIPRLDGPAKVTGAAHYAGDQHLANQLYAVIVGATVPAARIDTIDTSAALQIPGVVRILVASDLPKVHADLEKITVPPLATRFMPMQTADVVYEGQPVAIVLGESLEAAEEGAARVRVSYTRNRFVVPDTASIELADPSKGNYSKSSALEFRKGNPESALAAAPIKVTATYTQPSRHANPMEPSAILAAWDGDHLTVYDSVQHLPAVQNTLAAAFGLSADSVRVISPHTGGGFGAKAFVWPHEILAAMAARVVRRPVKLVLSRQHMYGMVGPQPQIEQRIRLGADRSGKLLGIEHVAINVTGVTDDYVEFAAVPGRSFYACEHITTSQRIRRGHMTLPTFMRSPWDGPGSWALGSAMDELAKLLNIDPLDLRLANYAEVDPESGKPWSSKKLREAYEEGARRFGWRNRLKGGTRDGHWRIGSGMADCSQGQARFHSTARVRLKVDGSAQIESSFCDIGTGPVTVFSQVAADVLGLDPTRIKTLYGDTTLPYSGPTYGSGTTISTGAAVQQAAQSVRAKLAALAGWPAHDVSMKHGHLLYQAQSRSIEAIMRSAGAEELASDGSFDLPGGAFVDMGAPAFPARSFGAVFVEVGVDPELGLVRLRRATAVYSAGRIINPRTSRSQMIGGIVWGWGMATMEASHYEPTLGRWYAKDLAGVAIPVNADIPPQIDVGFVDEFDANAGPLGARGIGELAATGVAAAVANAVFDAAGVRIRNLPITPASLLEHLAKKAES